MEGNSKLEVTASIAQVVGPGAGGVLVRLVGAPLAVLVDAVSYVVSAFFLLSIRVPEPPPAAPAERAGFAAEFGQWMCLIVYYVNTVSVRQALTPDRLRGRVNATMRFIAGGMGARGVLIVQSSMPVAVFNCLFAQRNQRAPEEVAGLVVISTALSFVTLPLLLWYVL